MSDRWRSSDTPRGTEYDARFERLASAGVDVHGEAALVDSYGPGDVAEGLDRLDGLDRVNGVDSVDGVDGLDVLDAGCGTGRVAIELARRGHRVVGVDADPAMLEVARRKAPGLSWIEADLADPELDPGGPFDVVVMAGNVLLFVAPGTEGRVIANAAAWLAAGGRLVTGYSIRPGGFGPAAHDDLAAGAGLVLEDRWSSWERRSWAAGDDYVVSVHRRPG